MKPLEMLDRPSWHSMAACHGDGPDRWVIEHTEPHEEAPGGGSDLCHLPGSWQLSPRGPRIAPIGAPARSISSRPHRGCLAHAVRARGP
jgi:hypothetical protein